VAGNSILGRTSKFLLFDPDFCLGAFILDNVIDRNSYL
jgi:hypothetical protein